MAEERKKPKLSRLGIVLLVVLSLVAAYFVYSLIQDKIYEKNVAQFESIAQEYVDVCNSFVDYEDAYDASVWVGVYNGFNKNPIKRASYIEFAIHTGVEDSDASFKNAFRAFYSARSHIINTLESTKKDLGYEETLEKILLDGDIIWDQDEAIHYHDAYEFRFASDNYRFEIEDRKFIVQYNVASVANQTGFKDYKVYSYRIQNGKITKFELMKKYDLSAAIREYKKSYEENKRKAAEEKRKEEEKENWTRKSGSSKSAGSTDDAKNYKSADDYANDYADEWYEENGDWDDAWDDAEEYWEENH